LKLPTLKQIKWQVWVAGAWLLVGGSVALYLLWSSLPLLVTVFFVAGTGVGAIVLTVWAICTVSDFLNEIKYGYFG
jgi:hypothetical protein